MRLKVYGGLGDEIALTVVPREIRRTRDEMVRIWDSAYLDVWMNNPDINQGNLDDGRLHILNATNYEDPGRDNQTMGEDMCRQLGVGAVDVLPDLHLTDNERSTDFGLENKGRPIVAIDTWTTWPAKLWKHDRYVTVTKKLKKEGVHVIELGRDGDGSIGAATRTRIPSSQSFYQKTTVRELFQLLSQCDGYFGNDSGAFHACAALRVPHVVLFGPIRSRRLAYPSTVALEAKTDCSATCEKYCTRWAIPGQSKKANRCIDEVSPAAAVDAVLESISLRR